MGRHPILRWNLFHTYNTVKEVFRRLKSDDGWGVIKKFGTNMSCNVNGLLYWTTSDLWVSPGFLQRDKRGDYVSKVPVPTSKWTRTVRSTSCSGHRKKLPRETGKLDGFEVYPDTVGSSSVLLSFPTPVPLIQRETMTWVNLLGSGGVT